MDFNITLLPGDGVGPEIIDSAVAVLAAIEQKFGHNFHMHRMNIGGSAIDSTGVPLPKDTLEDCKAADAVLLGASADRSGTGSPPTSSPKKGF